MTKPVAYIKDAIVINNRLIGTITEYPEEHKKYPLAFQIGEEVTTSPIMVGPTKEEPNKVETQRTSYIVEWAAGYNPLIVLQRNST
jgi:hypothetical protein